MATLTVEIPELVARRLEALAAVQNKKVEQLALECLDSFAGSLASRRAVLKARRAAAKTGDGKYSMADLGWLDGYSGQAVDELLAFEATEHVELLLQTLEQAIQEKVKVQRLASMTGVERMVLALMSLKREVNNGGYHQFFVNSSRRFAPAIVSDLERIGCASVAEITQSALDALKLPELSVDAIEAAVTPPDAERDRVLNRCDNRFYETNELSELLFAYVKKHPDGICI